ncbi:MULTISPECIES: hypothetical protein [Streptomyces]|uniref:Uncharacterized protein n=1 Tax=Streptomyces fradiae ATCC 10745 = DSM 40063 TaxID=1319510 RepID=A0A1Y2NNV7_STRFR|nr:MULTISPECIES: hypothetical protein [Streptomyces]KAF0646285.1 hypothetical protein K701_29410 [Streptomyces fradiae ATCC 10745 = DSM 40063]OSY49070.1 hypothetical protein BG846_05309 [Streptomyces fradiae ATCC 10745 = DSM 40063]
MSIAPTQTYRSADPRGGPRIRIEKYTPGHAHAWVSDADTGKRARWVLVRSLHQTPTTRTGQPRRTGYIREDA